MSEFHVEAALRSLRGFPTRTLARRPDDQLPFVNEGELGGQALMLQMVDVRLAALIPQALGALSFAEDCGCEFIRIGRLLKLGTEQCVPSERVGKESRSPGYYP